ncbi:MAG: HlyD family efflux transporter periplasmic adaptor subunit [Burkholderiaceae bacterium]|uniref:HlyD family efflux transporter periplasmic adaptor subunit n=1 Tax=Herminiimonas contaminans TaxID=1111140 RepID=A0ABS0EQ97_9BURK|nr:HlyD family efflux transporter periplasmic adaptor subunit [Herminiimonas contaminans]MBF8177045.1 HlyD family efflux transporter periplasmic adaptor subunit [Herminiimonas contaminans]MBX9799001.1 HlyD family efflux transporter periplasmic adaptor subunit [Burkholderiaceae bacterium]
MPSSLPALRQELSISVGPRLPDGQPSWTLHDPVRNMFFQLDWPSFEMLSRWNMGDAEAILAEINSVTALQLDSAAFNGLLTFLGEQQLLQAEKGSAPALAAMRARQRGNWHQWLLHNYLFFRVPLLRPDRWLTWLEPRLAFLFSPTFRHLTILAGVLGLIGAYREWDRFSATLMDTLSWDGAVLYGAAIFFAKTCHELGHALTTKRYGCRVPTMGLAFLVMWPVAYTDTNEVWKLADRKKRLTVASAGIITELGIAAWATLAWAWLPEGGPKQVAFLLSTTTWISTLLINASPFMRFDGYYILSDYLGLPNLHNRAFALARWDLRERLFALGEPAPEAFSPRMNTGLILFAWAIWIYRLILFLGIAVLVYHFFIKAVGILLFIVEICWFVALPVWREIQVWRTRWPDIRHSKRARRSAALAALFIFIFLLPWPDRVRSSGLLQPQTRLALYAPPHATLDALPVASGQTVSAGQTLMQLSSPELDLRATESDAKYESLAWQSAAAGLDVNSRKDWQVLNDQLAYANAERVAVSTDLQRYQPVAPYAGVLVDIDPDLRPGEALKSQEYLGSLVAADRWQVVTYVDEEAVRRISKGDRALFIADGMAGPARRLNVVSIDRDASRTLNEPELASLFGGDVLVREKNGSLYPEHAVYRVVLDTDEALPATSPAWRGRVTIAGNWEIPALRFLRVAASVAWRETGF